MRSELVIDLLIELGFPYDDSCVNDIVENWENDHEEELKELDGFEIDREDVEIYWFDYVRANLF